MRIAPAIMAAQGYTAENFPGVTVRLVEGSGGVFEVVAGDGPPAGVFL